MADDPADGVVDAHSLEHADAAAEARTVALGAALRGVDGRIRRDAEQGGDGALRLHRPAAGGAQAADESLRDHAF